MTAPRDVMELVVEDAEAQGRADRVVMRLLDAAGTPVPRAEVHRWIDAGLVTADGKPIKRSQTLTVGSKLRIEFGAPLLSDAVPDPSVVFEVVYEDADLLVVDKPAGLVVHPARGHRSGTLVNGLLARGGFEAPADPRDPEGHLRPGIVHRLDKETSGVMVVAKNAAAREGLKALFQAHDIERTYTGIVVGQATEARHDTPHGRHPTNRRRFTTKPRDESRRAVTTVRVIQQYRGASLVRCTLATGRTHQIRVHLEAAGTPILADALYGAKPRDPGIAAIAEQLGRQALHAGVLGFVHPISGAHLRWESELPHDMQAALESLEKRSQG